MTKTPSIKKTAKAKKTAANKTKTVEKKALMPKAVKTVKPARKKLGKGLEDISALFLSDIKKVTVSPKKKTIKILAAKTVAPKLEKIKPLAVKTKDIAIKKTPKKVASNHDVKAARVNDLVFKKTVVKAEAKAVEVKEILAKKSVSNPDIKPAGLNNIVPKKTVAKVAEKTAVVKENVLAKIIASVAEKLDAAQNRNSKKTTAFTDKKTAKKTTGEGLEKVAVKKVEAKQATSKPIMNNTEVVGMGTFKKSLKEDKKPILTKLTEQKSSRTKTVSKTKENKKTQSLGPISELKNLFKKKKTAVVSVAASDIQPEQVIEDSKFFISKEPTVERFKEDEFYELPEGYGDNRIVIQVRDPYWLFAYWEVSQRKFNSVVEKYGDAIHTAKRVLRVHDITGVSFNGKNSNSFFDIGINEVAKNWYVNVGNPGRSYCIDIGLVLADGRFVLFARSNFVTTPIDAPSLITDEEWMIVEDDFNKLYGLSAGLGIGLSSGELRKQIKSRLKNLSSGILSSPGATTINPNRNFWMVVNTELIVYGATQPGSELTVQGKPIKLNQDGTFSLRFALPDGEQVIPVRAVSPDKVEERVITPVVAKNTV
jgi:uncharacterized protein